MAASELVLQFLVLSCEGGDLLVGFFPDLLDVFENDLELTVGDVGFGVRRVEFGGCEWRAGGLFGGRGVCDLCWGACRFLDFEGLLSLAHYNDNMAEEYRLTQSLPSCLKGFFLGNYRCLYLQATSKDVSKFYTILIFHTILIICLPTCYPPLLSLHL
jgi:hypothetical protein